MLLVAGALLVVPANPQDPGYHDFADKRAGLGLPNCRDVLTNAAFLAVGLVGMTRLARSVPRGGLDQNVFTQETQTFRFSGLESVATYLTSPQASERLRPKVPKSPASLVSDAPTHG